MNARALNALRNMLQIEYAKEKTEFEKLNPEIELSYWAWLELKVLRSKVTPALAPIDNRIRAKIRTFAEGQLEAGSGDDAS